VLWNTSKEFLASCADDSTLKIWHERDAKTLFTLEGHTREIYTARWRNAGPESDNPNLDEMLLSASFDGTARLWDPNAVKCVKTFRTHSKPVYAICFSPNAEYCCVGSFDKQLEVYHVDSGESVMSYEAPGGVFDIDWSDDNTKVCFWSVFLFLSTRHSTVFFLVDCCFYIKGRRHCYGYAHAHCKMKTFLSFLKNKKHCLFSFVLLLLLLCVVSYILL